MKEIMCYHCGELFIYDMNDIRPYLYHNCKDGTMTAHKNPNFNKTSTYITKKKKTQWHDFGEN